MFTIFAFILKVELIARDAHLSAFEFVPVSLRLGQLTFTGVAVLAVNRQEHVRVSASVADVARDDVHVVFLRYTQQYRTSSSSRYIGCTDTCRYRYRYLLTVLRLRSLTNMIHGMSTAMAGIVLYGFSIPRVCTCICDMSCMQTILPCLHLWSLVIYSA